MFSYINQNCIDIGRALKITRNAMSKKPLRVLLEMLFCNPRTVEEHLLKIDPIMDYEAAAKLVANYEKTAASFMHDANLTPTNFQKAAAIAAAKSVTATKGALKKQPGSKISMMTVPASAGKSLIIAMVTLILRNNRPHKIDNIIVVFTSKLLMEKD